MQDRLQEILKRERLTPARFAELVGVQRSSVSHIISGRNKPSLEFLRKIMTAFEHISPDWLISGVGPYKRAELNNMGQNKPESVADESTDGTIKFPNLTKSVHNQNISTKHIESTGKSEPQNGALEPEDSPGYRKKMKERNSGPKQIVKTILFYSDHTFEVFYPGSVKGGDV